MATELGRRCLAVSPDSAQGITMKPSTRRVRMRCSSSAPERLHASALQWDACACLAEILVRLEASQDPSCLVPENVRQAACSALDAAKPGLALPWLEG